MMGEVTQPAGQELWTFGVDLAGHALSDFMLSQGAKLEDLIAVFLNFLLQRSDKGSSGRFLSHLKTHFRGSLWSKKASIWVGEGWVEPSQSIQPLKFHCRKRVESQGGHHSHSANIPLY